jgi:hypothetical protein
MPSPSDLAPQLERASFLKSGKSLTVDAVAGDEQKDVLGVMAISVDNAVIRDALVQTLGDSGMFRKVSVEPGGDYRLAARVIAQRMDMNTLILLVRYQLFEGGARLWHGNLFSVKSISVGEVFSGAERTEKLRQAVFRDNFGQLAKQVNAALPAPMR